MDKKVTTVQRLIIWTCSNCIKNIFLNASGSRERERANNFVCVDALQHSQQSFSHHHVKIFSWVEPVLRKEDKMLSMFTDTTKCHW